MASHFQVCILSRESPFYASVLGIASPLPRIDFGGDRRTIRQAPIKALSIKDADFDFSHVQPTGVLWSVVKDHSTQKLVRFLDPEYFLKALVSTVNTLDGICRVVDHAA